jgi:hypothetical protein
MFYKSYFHTAQCSQVPDLPWQICGYKNVYYFEVAIFYLPGDDTIVVYYYYFIIIIFIGLYFIQGQVKP